MSRTDPLFHQEKQGIKMFLHVNCYMEHFSTFMINVVTTCFHSNKSRMHSVYGNEATKLILKNQANSLFGHYYDKNQNQLRHITLREWRVTFKKTKQSAVFTYTGVPYYFGSVFNYI